MAIRRRLFASTPGYSVSAKQRSYGMPIRTLPTYPKYSRVSSGLYDTRSEDALLFDRVSQVSYLSEALLDEGYDTARRSRGRDQQLLREATNAIPRSSSRDTSSSTSPARPASTISSRRFGRSKSAQSKRVTFEDDPSPTGRTSALSTSDVMASPPPRPSVIRHRFGARAPVLQSFLDDEPSLSKTLEHSDFPYRGQRHTSPPSKILAGYRPSSPSRHTLAPAPVSTLKESKYLGRPRASLHPRPSPYASADLNFEKSELPRYDLVYVDHEPGAKPFRRRPRVLGSSRRPAGNYYERLLRKRGKRRGKFGPYYDVESIEGSDLTDVLSDTGSLSDLDASYGTYDSSVIPSYTFQDYPLSSSPSSAYYVDQDTEYVPYGPSRHLETTGLLEVSSYNGNDDENEECSDSASLPSPMNDLSLSTYLPKSVVSSALSRSPYRAVVPYTSSFLDNCLDVMPSSSPSQKLLDSLVQTAVARARSAVDALALPDYHGASLVLSVEGAGKMADGKIVDFTYTPPPIPLFGRAPRLDDRIMGLSLKRKDVLRPVDDFLAGYVKRMESLRSELYGRHDNDKDKDKRPRYGLTAAETPSRQYSTPSYSTYKPYTSSHTYVPVRHLSSQRTEHVPVTSYRRDLDDGRSHRMDVFPLSVIKPRIAESTPKAITLPGAVTKDGSPVQLSVLDRINIKVSSESYATPQTSVASRRVARGRVVRAASVPPRPAPPAYSEVDRSKATTAASTTTTKTSGIKFVPSRPIIVYTVRPEYDRRARSVPPQVKRAEKRAVSVPPSVYYGGKAEEKAQPRVVISWRSLTERWIRASSAPPARRRRRALRATPRYIFDEQPPPPLPTANLRAHKVPRRFLSRGPVRTPFSSLYGYYQHDRPLAKARKPDRTAEEEQRARIRRLVLMSRVLGSSSLRVSPAQPRSRVGARVRSLLAPAAPKPRSLPARQSLIGFPQVYVPSKGPKPSNRAKAAIIASKLEPDPIKRRRPRSQFAADKLRSMRKEAQESVYTGTASAGLSASTPPLPRTSERKAIRTEEGFSKPKNILSWQYRVESRIPPNDLLYQPSSFIRIREQVRNAQERMDRHRQLLDRYLPDSDDTGDIAAKVLRKTSEMEKRNASYRAGGGADSTTATVKNPALYATGVEQRTSPVSELRRRIRKTLNKSRMSYS